MPKQLTDKQAALVREYLKDYNKTQAAIRAGYKPESVNHNISQIYCDRVMTAIKEASKAITIEADVTAKDIVRELSIIAGLNKGEADDDNVIKVNVGDKLRALELLGRSLAMFTDKTISETTTTNTDMSDAQRQALSELAASWTRKSAVKLSK